MGGRTAGHTGAAIETVVKIAGVVDIFPQILG
jgi:hypothetical protein